MSLAFRLFSVGASGALAVAACSASDSGGGSGGGPATSGTAGSSGASSSGAISTGGSGGGIVIDGGGGNAGLSEDAACSQITQKAENKLQPADIIFALDNFGSMDEEANFVQATMSMFSNGIVTSNIDAHVVILSAGSNQSNGRISFRFSRP